MEDIKKYLLEIFNAKSIVLLIAIFVGSLIFGVMIDSFLISLRDACMITVATAVILVFIDFSKELDKKDKKGV
jgi:hypothetical protein